jgi:hypothetical protein
VGVVVDMGFKDEGGRMKDEKDETASGLMRGVRT